MLTTVRHSREAAFEDELVGEGDGFVDGEPVADEIHEVLIWEREREGGRG